MLGAVSHEVREASQELLQMKWEPYTRWHVKQTPGSKEGIRLHTCNLPCPNSKCRTAAASCYRKLRVIRFHPQVDDIQTMTYQDGLTNGSKCRNWFQILKTQLATTKQKPSWPDFNFNPVYCWPNHNQQFLDNLNDVSQCAWSKNQNWSYMHLDA